jgi:hypothetical protein
MNHWWWDDDRLPKFVSIQTIVSVNYELCNNIEAHDRLHRERMGNKKGQENSPNLS